MSDEAEEAVEPVTVGVRVEHYNEIMDAADIGFVAMVRRRDTLKALMDRMPYYPERDASKMKALEPFMFEGVEISRDDVADMWRRAEDKLKRLASAMNSRYAPSVGDKYKA